MLTYCLILRRSLLIGLIYYELALGEVHTRCQQRCRILLQFHGGLVALVILRIVGLLWQDVVLIRLKYFRQFFGARTQIRTDVGV